MDTTDRPHRTTNNTTSDLFVCFTSRLSSSSSMKLSSKSILSPSRSRDPPSLSSSLSRRLKSNGSMKGGQASPMFPTTGNGKRRGCGFENPEPSSPKVTCIGQVRVKTKKQGKKMRAARSKRRGSEASFRKTEQPDLTRQNSQSIQFVKHRNQRWVHLPLTICEALREFSCFFPCRSSCMSGEREKEKVLNGVDGGGGGERSGHGGREDGSCGAAFQRWIVALQDGDGNGKGRGIEFVMQEEDIEDCDNGGREKAERSCSQRRHVFEDIDIDLVEGKTQEEMKEGEEEEEKARVSICIPPKNALLLMRCRSDPVKMAALANRFWESPVQKEHYEERDEEEEEDSGEEDEEEEEQEQEQEEGEEEDQHNEMEEDEKEVERKTQQQEKNSIFESETEPAVAASEEERAIPLPVEAKSEDESRTTREENGEISEANQVKEDKEENEDEGGNEDGKGIQQGETFSCALLFESHADLEKPETEETHPKENNESSELSSSPETFTASEPESDEAKEKAEESPEAEFVMAEAASEQGSTEKEEEEKVTEQSKQYRETEPTRDPNTDSESNERENGSNLEERERQRLPECLLLMMCEPKLSMEVSKETWVCSTDFIRWLPERPAVKKDGAGGAKKLGSNIESSAKLKPKLPPQPPMQPPRSSCSFPTGGGGAGMSMATMIEQKLIGPKSGNGYEPFVLTRCKSEPMRSSAKLAPEACFWNNRKLEPHPPPAPLGVGAPAGVGF